LNSIVHLEKTDYHLPSVLQVGLNGIAAANLQTGIYKKTCMVNLSLQTQCYLILRENLKEKMSVLKPLIYASVLLKADWFI